MIAYIGGKYRMAKWIESFMPKDIKVYAEVFGGAYWNYIKGSFDCDVAHYNDVNRFMANLFACCQNYETLSKLVDTIEPQDVDRFNRYKKDILEILGTEFDYPDHVIATKYVYLVTQIFSGIMSEKAKMVDLKGKYRSKYHSFADRLHKPKICDRLNKIQASNLSYETFIPMVDSSDTFLYLDPPYYGTENLYAFHDFGLADHDRLISMMKECDSKWALSYYVFDDLKKWLPEDKYHWELKEFKKASMATKGGKQSIGTEVLIMNY